MSSVLSSLSLGMFEVAQALSSLTFDCIEEVSRISCQESSANEMSNEKSSANESCVIECESIMADKGLICMEKRIGPITEP